MQLLVTADGALIRIYWRAHICGRELKILKTCRSTIFIVPANPDGTMEEHEFCIFKLEHWEETSPGDIIVRCVWAEHVPHIQVGAFNWATGTEGWVILYFEV
jgi:hypothetical protein